MVTVAHRTPEQLRTWAEHVLPSLLAAWEDLPGDLEEIDTWDSIERLSYIEEWRHKEAQRITLGRVVKREVLTKSQMKLYGELNTLSRRYGRDLDNLLSAAS